MSNYTGVRCPVCSKKFSQADDIVVCPTCGAPHHRECYAEKGECAFAADHLSGNVWRAPEQPAAEEKDQKICSRCNAVNPPDSLFCQVCGNSLTVQGPTPQANTQPGQAGTPFGYPMPPGMEMLNDPLYTIYGGVDPKEELEGESVEDVAAYVGNSTAYFLPRFKLMSQTGKTISPNFAAFFFSFFYFFYRKMYLLGAIILALRVVGLIPSFLYAREVFPLAAAQMGLTELFEQAGIAISAMEVNNAAAQHYYNLNQITRMINFAIMIIVSVSANRFYFEQAIRKVRGLKAGYTVEGVGVPQAEAYRQSLTKAGGVSKTAPILVGVGLVVGYFVMCFVMVYSGMF